MITPEEKVSTLIEAEAQAIKIEDGDVFDEDTGNYIGTLDLSMDSVKGNSIPAQISIVLNGIFYTFRMDSRSVISEEERKQIEIALNADADLSKLDASQL